MIIIRAPLRISFVGGGSDFPEFFKDNVKTSEGGAKTAKDFFNK
jgi:galactokinase/mevalonate kinase-like predicted kinase